MQNLGIYGNSDKIAEKIQERPGAGIWTTNRRGREREGTGREFGGNLAGSHGASAGTGQELTGGGGNLAGPRRELGGNSAGTWWELGRNLAGTWQELVFSRALSTIFPEFSEIPRFHGFRSTKLNMCSFVLAVQKSLAGYMKLYISSTSVEVRYNVCVCCWHKGQPRFHKNQQL